MKTRNIWTAVAGAAVAGGTLISGAALPSSPEPDTMTITALIPDPGSDGFLSCTITVRDEPAGAEDVVPTVGDASAPVDHGMEAGQPEGAEDFVVTDDHPVSFGDLPGVDAEVPCPYPPGGDMTYSESQVSSAVAAMEKYRGDAAGEVGTALAVVGLSAERAAKEALIRDDMIRVAHRAGASLRQLAEVADLDRKTVTAIVGAPARPNQASSP